MFTEQWADVKDNYEELGAVSEKIMHACPEVMLHVVET